ncbi:MAG: MarR family winged helix-turn-helix transcriptional regulator [Stellaceae bacterium]
MMLQDEQDKTTGQPPAAHQRASSRRPTAAVPEIDLGALKNFVGFNLRLAQDVSFRSFAQRTGMKHLRPGRFAALMVLRDNPDITPGALGRAIARDKSSVTPLVQDLQRNGLIRRKSSPTDHRSVTLTLTPAGQRLLRDLIGHARAHDDQLDEIAGAAKAEFVAILQRIADAFG